MKREYKCTGCGLIITGRESTTGEVFAAPGPPDPDQLFTKPRDCVCVQCSNIAATTYGKVPYAQQAGDAVRIPKRNRNDPDEVKQIHRVDMEFVE